MNTESRKTKIFLKTDLSCGVVGSTALNAAASGIDGKMVNAGLRYRAEWFF